MSSSKRNKSPPSLFRKNGGGLFLLPPTTHSERVSECPVGWMDGFLPHSVKFDGTQNTLEREKRGEGMTDAVALGRYHNPKSVWNT